jgi:hypothetical protein
MRIRMKTGAERGLVKGRKIYYTIRRNPCSVVREKVKIDPNLTDRESGFTVRSPALGIRGKWTEGGRIPRIPLSGSISAFPYRRAGILFFSLTWPSLYSLSP